MSSVCIQKLSKNLHDHTKVAILLSPSPCSKGLPPATAEVGVAIPVTSTVKEVYRLAMQQGLGEKDFSAIHSFLQEGSGNKK